MTGLFILLGLLLLASFSLGLVSLKVARNISGLMSASDSLTFTDALGEIANQTVIAAQPATLTVRTDGTNGTLTMTNVSHGISTGQRIDLYWAGGQAYHCTVGTVAGTSVPFTVTGGGTALPAATTAITVGISTSAPFNVVGNNVQCLALQMPTGTNLGGYIVFNNGGTDVYAAFLPAGWTWTWKLGDPLANPLAGATPTLVYFSHSASTSVSGIQAAAVAH